MDNVERLMEFGLTRHEASLYILLTLEGSLNLIRGSQTKAGSQDRTLTMHWQALVDKGAAYIQRGRYSSLHTGSDRRILQ